jgi:hypothetical protein
MEKSSGTGQSKRRTLESLGGTVEGKKHTWTIDVKDRELGPSDDPLSRYVVVKTTNEKGDVRIVELRMKPGDGWIDLKGFVDSIKSNAAIDFNAADFETFLYPRES